MTDYSYLHQLSLVYIEVTNKCNLACKYCYALQRHEVAHVMSYETFQRIIDLVALHSKCTHISIIFHGGEPLLANSRFYEQCITYANTCLKKVNKTVDYGIQSNLLLLDDAMTQILKENNVIVSTSIDGPQNIHDQARAGWGKTIEHYHKLKAAGVQVNFISVCSHHNKNHIRELFQFAKGLGAHSLQLNIASSPERLYPSYMYSPMSAEDILHVFKDILACILEFGIIEKKMEQKIRYFLSPSAERVKLLRCDSPFCHAGVNMLVFTPDGTIHACSPAVPLTIIGENYSLGSINEPINIEQFQKTLALFHSKGDKYNEECSNCEASRICDFGCPAFDRIDPITAENHCIATKALFRLFEGMTQQELNRYLSA